MPPTASRTVAAGWSSLILPVTIVGAILVFVIPVPPAVLDLLLAANITLSILVLLTTLSIRSPQEFSAFPTILLTTTRSTAAASGAASPSPSTTAPSSVIAPPPEAAASSTEARSPTPIATSPTTPLTTSIRLHETPRRGHP
ncbi:FHIPEP family type III secretion protein [Singulisphaera rosea]